MDISEKDDALIERVAKWIVDSGLETPAIMALQTMKPLSTIGGELAFFYLAPFLPLLEDKGYDFIDTFEKRENIERLIRRVNQLSRERAREKKGEKGPSFWSTLKRKFSSSKQGI